MIHRPTSVLMTVLVASMGFAPVALCTGVGAKVQRPPATVVIGDVVSRILLTLLVLPVLYDLVGTFLSGQVPARAWRTRVAGTRLLLPSRRQVPLEGLGSRGSQLPLADGLVPAGRGRDRPLA